jgi:predicted RNA-binding Zn ribbon-like protein
MVIIRLVNGDEWYKSNWVFRQLAEDVAARFPDETDLRTLLDRAEALGMLRLDSLDKAAASQTLRAIDEVANETLRGKIQGWKRNKPEDVQGQRDYLAALCELRELIGKSI